MNAYEIVKQAIYDIDHDNITLGEFERQIEPTKNVKPIVYGEWELVDDTFDEIKDYKCNLCGQLCAMSIYKMMNFCPNCGATMKKKSEEKE